ncbi:choice-of-anchor L domain-containing protein [Fluviicola sp.]|uniref:choice-of-anchor L domain-containing protein n=1 Tax=Fluviicola sp. TaxID=1917219 RepID=UPI0031D635B2
MKYLFSLILFSQSFLASSQLITGGNNPADFIATALSSDNVSISNVSYSGSLSAICYFSANVQNMPFSSGVLMTTGIANFTVGPNDENNSGVDNGFPGYSPLTSMLAAASFNAAIVSFDVIPNGDTLKIRYVFGSEEYPEYVCSQSFGSGDGFAIYISGPGIPGGSQNIARLPNGAPITINTVNGGNPGNTGSGIGACQATNSQYFVNNGNGVQAPYNSNNTYVQFDGLTVPLTAKSAVTPGQMYQVIIAIADAGDGVFDSGVFLEEGGITAGINENTLENFVSIAYNPSNQQATIQITEYPENLTYTVVDLSGKVMQQSKITETTNIDLSDYASGMYLIRVEGSNGQVSKKVIR